MHFRANNARRTSMVNPNAAPKMMPTNAPLDIGSVFGVDCVGSAGFDGVEETAAGDAMFSAEVD